MHLQGFYLYLYVGSMLFLLFMYATIIWGRPKPLKSPSKYDDNFEVKKLLSLSNSYTYGIMHLIAFM